MKTEVVKPQEIFYAPTRLLVPLFQRPYVWKRERQWEPLWQDIVRLIEVLSKHDPTATHFLGAIVIQQVQTGLGSLTAWNVIDGQQRLTTLQILLDAVHAELERRGLRDEAARIVPLIENPENMVRNDEDRFKLWPTNRDRAAFSDVMTASAPVDYAAIEQSQLRDAHRFFAEAAREWLDADDAEVNRRAYVLVATITERLEIASIRLDPHEDAQAIFETLNGRNTPLSAADLIKNFVFQQMPEAETERAYFEYWEQFETPWWEQEVTSGRIKNTRSSLFLWQWLVARLHDDFPIREVFTQFKYYANTHQGGVLDLLPMIRRAADRYREVIEGATAPAGELSRTQLFSYRVDALRTDVARPLLIWLDEPEQATISYTDRVRILEVLESWFVRRALAKAPSQGSNRVIVDLLRQLTGLPAHAVSETVEEFFASNHTAAGYWPGDDDVRSVLSEARAYAGYRRSVQRIVFEALEDAKRGYPDGRRLAMGPIVRGRATIEHIMPQRWRQNWPADLTEDEQTNRDWRIQQIGNLTIVTQSLNTRVSNGPWEAKRTHFLETDDVLITKDAINLAGHGDWDESTIARRTGLLLEQILALWTVPEGHVGRVVESSMASSATSVSLADLIGAGLLEPGTRLVPGGGYFRPGVEATVQEDGRLRVGEIAYEYPSRAAHAVHGVAANGWWFWELAGEERRLRHVRDEYLARRGGTAEIVTDEVEGNE